MLEALLEKFIINYLGRYFSGLDKKNIDIGVWKGDVSIENLALNHELFDIDSFPLEALFSHIGRVSLKVPWSTLSSASVELTIEDLFLLLRIRPKHEWIYRDFNTLECKFKIIKKFAETVFEKLSTIDVKPAQKSGPPGSVEKILIKIIDNLQITIKNIHVRIESDETPTFAAGFYLAHLKVMTVDQTFSSKIYQKFESHETGRVVRKLAKISAFQIYWASQPKHLWMKQELADTFHKRFKNFDLDEVENCRIISLTADVRLTINEKGGFFLEGAMSSKYIVDIDIPFLEFKLTMPQIKDILTFLANIDAYKSAMAISLECVSYYIFRPAEKIRDAKPQDKRKVIQKWWRYLGKSGRHQERIKAGRYNLLT